ncbi:hypothetical protein Tco_1414318 [Tanacetum coccineum]
MVHDSVLNCPLDWGTIKANGVTRTKTYEELSEKEKLQADCDLKATNIVFQFLPSDVYSLVNHHNVAKEIWDRVSIGTNTPYLLDGHGVLMYNQLILLHEPKYCIWHIIDVDTAYSSKSGNGLLIRQSLGYIV